MLPGYLAVFGTSKYEIVRGLECCQVDLAAFGTSAVEVWNAARLLGIIRDLEIRDCARSRTLPGRPGSIQDLKC